ncbi:MAG TPA: hypothetical protein VNZ52_01355 [Candidatus Thermoplasmatota archaeon]|nr:hypothetical protein [Candidatus Thermoplasmatota archaeon]
MTQQSPNDRAVGLLTSVARTLASQPAMNRVHSRLQEVSSPEEFRDYLESVDLGIEPEARAELVEAITGEDWEGFRNRLRNALEVSRIDQMSPGS